MADKALSFSLADFFFNDSPDVLTPPSDYLAWIEHPKIQAAMHFFGQQFLTAPRAEAEVLNVSEGAPRKVINMTSYNYLGLSSHPEVIQAAKDALDRYGLGASGAPLLSGTFDLHVEFARRLAEFKQKEDCLLYSSGLGGTLAPCRASCEREMS